ncbi:oxidoreductase domain containing protein, partial [Acanthamoeba castellanii str. Neff]
ALVPEVAIKSGQTWSVVGLNHRWRFCRHRCHLTVVYTPGQHCEPHVDAAYKPSSSERSLFTFMLYLNEGFGGVTPLTGMALVFEHNIVHEGERLASDVKYIMRTEVMYRRQPKKWG